MRPGWRCAVGVSSERNRRCAPVQGPAALEHGIVVRVWFPGWVLAPPQVRPSERIESFLHALCPHAIQRCRFVRRRLFTDRHMPCTVYACALALERNPEAAHAMVEAGWEVASHGYRSSPAFSSHLPRLLRTPHVAPRPLHPHAPPAWHSTACAVSGHTCRPTSFVLRHS